MVSYVDMICPTCCYSGVGMEIENGNKIVTFDSDLCLAHPTYSSLSGVLDCENVSAALSLFDCLFSLDLVPPFFSLCLPSLHQVAAMPQAVDRDQPRWYKLDEMQCSSMQRETKLHVVSMEDSRIQQNVEGYGQGQVESVQPV